MSYHVTVALVIFLITYALIVSEKVQRTVIALFGAMLMVLAGVITQEQAIHHIDFNTLALLIGMMIQVLVLSKTGLFRYLSVWAAQKTNGNPVALLIALSVMVGVCSAFLDNVTTVPVNAGDARDARSIPGSGRSPGEGNGNLLQYSCLGNPIDRGAWWATVHGVARESDRT